MIKNVKIPNKIGDFQKLQYTSKSIDNQLKSIKNLNKIISKDLLELSQKEEFSLPKSLKLDNYFIRELETLENKDHYDLYSKVGNSIIKTCDPIISKIEYNLENNNSLSDKETEKLKNLN